MSQLAKELKSKSPLMPSLRRRHTSEHGTRGIIRRSFSFCLLGSLQKPLLISGYSAERTSPGLTNVYTEKCRCRLRVCVTCGDGIAEDLAVMLGRLDSAMDSVGESSIFCLNGQRRDIGLCHHEVCMIWVWAFRIWLVVLSE